MKRIIDISWKTGPQLPVWPGSPGFELIWNKRLNSGDDCNNSILKCDSHVGTHVDAPFHFVASGDTVEHLDLGLLVGPCCVIDLPGVKKITAADFARVAGSIETPRILLRTDNSTIPEKDFKVFHEDFVALEPDAAQWIVDNNIKLVGIDYLSIGRFKNGRKTHQILLNAGVAVVEGLNLRHVQPDNYELICLPMKILGAEGAPARAILRV